MICPTSLKHQWREEITKFTDRPAIMIEGLLAVRKALYAEDDSRGQSSHIFKIVNYDVIHRDLTAIRNWAPDLIILDEAQRIKNWKTRAARTVKRLFSQYAIVLTGTPLENRLEELHSIVEFIDRFRLGPAYRFLAEHQHVDGHGKVIGYRNLSAVNTTLKPILVRRTKAGVLKQLPERLDKTFFVPMTPEQQTLHEDNRETVAKLVAKWRRHRFLSELDQRRLTIALQRMRMACNSTYLLDQKTDFGLKCEELMALLEEMFEQPETKVIVFSQWLRTHELIEQRLDARQWGRVLFHGGVPGKERKNLVRRFKEDPNCRLFLATDAGGVGLNLQNASVVVNMDQPWNPAVLEQRIGRAHRLGQHRPVRVVNFVAQGTIEHSLLSLLAFKRSVFAGALDGGSDEVLLGGTRLSKFMESVEQATISIPASMPSSNGETAETQAIPDAMEIAEEAADEEHAANIAVHAGVAPSHQQQVWSDVAAAGLSLLEKLTHALSQPAAVTVKPDSTQKDSLMPMLNTFVHQEPASGEQYLRLPVPAADVLQKAADLLSSFAALARPKE